MKKILALVLAVMMMAAMGTMAFAKDANIGSGTAGSPGTADANPGGKILVYIDAFDADGLDTNPVSYTHLG